MPHLHHERRDQASDRSIRAIFPGSTARGGALAPAALPQEPAPLRERVDGRQPPRTLHRHADDQRHVRGDIDVRAPQWGNWQLLERRVMLQQGWNTVTITRGTF